MKYLAIVHESGSESRVSKKAADERLAQWMREIERSTCKGVAR